MKRLGGFFAIDGISTGIGLIYVAKCACSANFDGGWCLHTRDVLGVLPLLATVGVVGFLAGTMMNQGYSLITICRLDSAPWYI
jgi:hypothetical protein